MSSYLKMKLKVPCPACGSICEHELTEGEMESGIVELTCPVPDCAEEFESDIYSPEKTGDSEEPPE